jgi:hypothetical protein
MKDFEASNPEKKDLNKFYKKCKGKYEQVTWLFRLSFFCFIFAKIGTFLILVNHAWFQSFG